MESFLDKLFRKRSESEFDVPALPSGDIGPIIDTWIAQAQSLRELRLYAHEQRKLTIAEKVALKRIKEQPEAMGAWHSLGDVYLATQRAHEAAEAFLMIKNWSEKSGNTYWLEAATDGLIRVARLEATLQRVPYERNIIGMFYACQSCGNLILFLGSHCPHCKFAPATPHEAATGIVLSIMRFTVPDLLAVSRSIQWKEPPADFVDGFEEIVHSAEAEPSVAAVLGKLKEKSADDFLDFQALETCHECGNVTNHSWLSTCSNCGHKLNRPDLMNLALCVHRILQHFIWGIRRSESPEFAKLITLLVNIKYRIIRQQEGPTDAERTLARRLLEQISPLWTQNNGGYVEVKSPDCIRGCVVDESVHPQIGRTISSLEGELRNYTRLTSDQVGLF